jgi:hypothetical protein
MDKFERYGVGAGPDWAGKLVKYTSLGCYPVFYLDNSGHAVLCATCANADEDNGREPSAADINWEDPALLCDECSERIESAYAEDLAEKPKCSTCGEDRHPGIRCE